MDVSSKAVYNDGWDRLLPPGLVAKLLLCIELALRNVSPHLPHLFLQACVLVLEVVATFSSSFGLEKNKAKVGKEKQGKRRHQ